MYHVYIIYTAFVQHGLVTINKLMLICVQSESHTLGRNCPLINTKVIQIIATQVVSFTFMGTYQSKQFSTCDSLKEENLPSNYIAVSYTIPVLITQDPIFVHALSTGVNSGWIAIKHDYMSNHKINDLPKFLLNLHAFFSFEMFAFVFHVLSVPSIMVSKLR